jgi:hypothetical protein
VDKVFELMLTVKKVQRRRAGGDTGGKPTAALVVVSVTVKKFRRSREVLTLRSGLPGWIPAVPWVSDVGIR